MALAHAQNAGTHLFQCVVQGEPPPSIRWVKDGKEIVENSRFWFDYAQDGVVSMVIRDVIPADSGHYECIAENSEGIAVSSSRLLVTAHTGHPKEPVLSAQMMEMDDPAPYQESKLEPPLTYLLPQPESGDHVPVPVTRSDSEDRVAVPVTRSDTEDRVAVPVTRSDTEDRFSDNTGIEDSGNFTDDQSYSDSQPHNFSAPPSNVLPTSSSHQRERHLEHQLAEASVPFALQDQSPRGSHTAGFASDSTECVSHLLDDSGYFDTSVLFNDSNTEESNNNSTVKTLSNVRSDTNDPTKLHDHLHQAPNDGLDFTDSPALLDPNSAQIQPESALSNSVSASSHDYQFPIEASGSSLQSHVTNEPETDFLTHRETAGTDAQNTSDVDEAQEISRSSAPEDRLAGSFSHDAEITYNDDTDSFHKDRPFGSSNDKEKPGNGQNSEELQQHTTWVDYLDSETNDSPSSVRYTFDYDGFSVNQSEPAVANIDRSVVTELERFVPQADSFRNMDLSPTHLAHTFSSLPQEQGITETETAASYSAGNDQALALPSQASIGEGPTVLHAQSLQSHIATEPSAPLEVIASCSETDALHDTQQSTSALDEISRNSDNALSVLDVPQGTSRSQEVDTLPKTETRAEDTESCHDELEPNTATVRLAQRMAETLSLALTNANAVTASTSNQPMSSQTSDDHGDSPTAHEEKTSDSQLEEVDLSSIEIVTSRQEGEPSVYRISGRSYSGEATLESSVDISDMARTMLDDGAVQLSFRATLQVPQFVDPPSDVTVSPSETIILTCVVKGYPDPHVTWVKDKSRTEIKGSSRVFLTRQGDVHRLEIRSAGPSDSGQYVCTASNSEGQVTATVVVTVEEFSTSVDGDLFPLQTKDFKRKDKEESENDAEDACVSWTSEKADEKCESCEDEGAVGGALLPGAPGSVSRTPQDSRTIRYAKLVGMAAAFSLAALGANKAFEIIRK
ncbi:protogenin [Plakobranchus ocellatus]|uniref:Protogenin n=1 Tax=Plakobranchus ocellatus TaxID=259542 RepID=A0AAV4B2K4_9GAST|nr:protogenin [Plakobranchus ocellatus]